VSQIAEGFSLKAFEIKGPKDLGPVLEEAFSTKKPCFVMVDVLPEDRLISPVPRWIQPGRDRGLLCMY
jgi:thiamine pyrophosphate-dependent acetolactate synthase large subunit-like protein